MSHNVQTVDDLLSHALDAADVVAQPPLVHERGAQSLLLARAHLREQVPLPPVPAQPLRLALPLQASAHRAQRAVARSERGDAAVVATPLGQVFAGQHETAALLAALRRAVGPRVARVPSSSAARTATVAPYRRSLDARLHVAPQVLQPDLLLAAPREVATPNGQLPDEPLHCDSARRRSPRVREGRSQRRPRSETLGAQRLLQNAPACYALHVRVDREHKAPGVNSHNTSSRRIEEPRKVCQSRDTCGGTAKVVPGSRNVW
ncbi:uncharacterized protein LOC114912480 [Scleropages formosus]|uniref:uncharacterized protein LOC114912480 n=1 Tax=Scleropages formosus TaxID=113540 RepID=UPI0010FA7E97|nr:uncharacterized protein LOC114912480 [Scleropages formosus]